MDSYISGIIAGMLDGAGYACRVTAHSVALEEGETPPSSSSLPSTLPLRKEKAVFLVKFQESVLRRAELNS